MSQAVVSSGSDLSQEPIVLVQESLFVFRLSASLCQSPSYQSLHVSPGQFVEREKVTWAVNSKRFIPLEPLGHWLSDPACKAEVFTWMLAQEEREDEEFILCGA